MSTWLDHGIPKHWVKFYSGCIWKEISGSNSTDFRLCKADRLASCDLVSSYPSITCTPNKDKNPPLIWTRMLLIFWFQCQMKNKLFCLKSECRLKLMPIVFLVVRLWTFRTSYKQFSSASKLWNTGLRFTSLHRFLLHIKE